MRSALLMWQVHSVPQEQRGTELIMLANAASQRIVVEANLLRYAHAARLDFGKPVLAIIAETLHGVRARSHTLLVVASLAQGGRPRRRQAQCRKSVR